MERDYPIARRDMIYVGLIILGALSYAHGTTFATRNNSLYVEIGKILLYAGFGLLVADKIIKRVKGKK